MNTEPGRILRGDGTWPFTAQLDGDDIVLRGVKATCFGGAHDPQDDGGTASGINTKKHPDIQAVSLPMDGRQFTGLNRHERAALNGSPIPRMPWHTPVEITIRGETVHFVQGVIDLGPGKQATRPGDRPHAVDLTEGAARLFDPHATSTNFEAVADVRIIGAAKYAPPA
jgi:hypothetical protein